MERITAIAGNKVEMYEELIPQIVSLVSGEEDLIANMANICAALKTAFDYFSWVGFYVVKGNELVLGPFQGKVACVRIGLGKGVCGTAARYVRTIVVADVEKFPGHIACDPGSKSEIVVPIVRDGRILGVLDVDSTEYGAFDEADRRGLERLMSSVNLNFAQRFAVGD